MANIKLTKIAEPFKNWFYVCCFFYKRNIKTVLFTVFSYFLLFFKIRESNISYKIQSSVNCKTYDNLNN